MNILGLKEYYIFTIDESEHDFHIQAELIASPSCCAHCGHPKFHRHEVKPQLYMDIPIRNKHVGVIVRRRRYLCCGCKRTFFEKLPYMDEHHFMTERLVNYVRSEALHRTFASLAKDTGLVEGTIRLLFAEFTANVEPRLPNTKEIYLGIDELYLLNQYRCVITDVHSHQIIDLLRDRKKDTVITYLQSLLDETKQQIIVVCTDMWSSYHDAARKVLPHVHLVVDKFHVLQLLSGCLHHLFLS